jgi:transcriptional regulator with XRE-family HTH domain
MKYFDKLNTVIEIMSIKKYRNCYIFKSMETDFKTNLRSELDYLGLTVKELSVKTGIAKGTLDCYLGVRASMPPADIATKIASTLGVTVEYLVTGQKAKKLDKLFDHNIRSIIDLLLELNEKDIETILGLSIILKKQSEKHLTPCKTQPKPMP